MHLRGGVCAPIIARSAPQSPDLSAATPQITMKTLFDLIQPIPADRTAIILPESNLRISYGAFRDQVAALAEALAAAGIGRGDRVGIALPNGLPMLVSFFAAATTGT